MKQKNQNSKPALISIMIFIVCTFTVILLLNYVYISTVYSSLEVTKKENAYKSHISQSKNISYLILGDSHASAAIMPALIDSRAFNYATPSENYIQTYYKLRKAVEKENVRPDVVILELDEHSLYPSMGSGNVVSKDLYFYGRFMSFEELKKESNLSAQAVFLKRSFPVLANGPDWFDLAYAKLSGAKFSTSDAQGYSSIDNDFTDNGLYRARLHYQNQEGLSLALIYHLNMTINLALENNARVIIVSYPLHRSYIDVKKNFTIVPTDQYYKAIIKNLELEEKQICILNHQTSFADNSTFFKDSDHLSHYGSKIFTSMILKEINGVLSNYSSCPSIE